MLKDQDGYLEARCPGVVCGVGHVHLQHNPPLELRLVLGALLAPVGPVTVLDHLLVALPPVSGLTAGLVQGLVLAGVEIINMKTLNNFSYLKNVMVAVVV